MFAQCLADPFSFTVAAQVLFPGRVVICMGCLGGAVDELGVITGQFAFQLLADPVPDIRMVGTCKGGYGRAVDGVEAERAGRFEAAALALVNAQQGHGGVHCLHGVGVGGITVWEVIGPGLDGAVTGNAKQVALTHGKARLAPGLISIDDRIGNTLAEKLEQGRVEARPVTAENIVEIAAQILAGTRVGVGNQQGHGMGGHIGMVGDQFCYPVAQHQRAAAKIQLYDSKRGLAGAFQVERPCLEPGAKAVCILCPGGITELGYAGGRRNVPFSDTCFCC